MGRHTQARRHSAAPPTHWTHQLAALPWITVVLVITLVVGGIDLLRPNRYAAQSTLSATEVRPADRAAMLLADPDLVPRVEQAMEVGADYQGRVRLSVTHEQDDPLVHVEALAPDPRLAALAADTAAVLIIGDRPDDGLSLAEAAMVPTEPTRGRNLTWAWVALVALLGAVRMEGAHRIWLREHAHREAHP